MAGSLRDKVRSEGEWGGHKETKNHPTSLLELLRVGGQHTSNAFVG